MQHVNWNARTASTNIYWGVVHKVRHQFWDGASRQRVCQIMTVDDIGGRGKPNDDTTT